jgi:N-acetylmuramic acid 6-phosphate etherase
MGNQINGRPTEARHPASQGLHLAEPGVALGYLLSAQIAALDALRPAFSGIGEAAERAAAALSFGHRVIYAGAGSSGLMALADCLELAGTFGIPPDRTPMMFAGGADALLHMCGAVEDDPARAETDLARVAPVPGDVVFALSASGGTPYTLAVVGAAKARGAFVVGIANVAGSALLRAVDLPVLIDTGPEVIAGSTRMGAATAQKVALNMISTLVGIRLGHVHDGMMVNLVADNAKLTDRAARIVDAISGSGMDAARGALAATGGAVKPAVLVARGMTASQAVELLQRTEGHLAPALAGLQE